MNSNLLVKDRIRHGDEYEELQRKMFEAIEQLKPEEKAVVIETEFNNRTFNELSKGWDIPVGTLLARKHRALGKLHKILTG